MGIHKKNKTLLNLALDRIQEIHEMPSIPMITAPQGIEHFYQDMIGVTKSMEQKASTAVLKVTKEHLPYLIVKPFHRSLMSIDVVLNFELERELLGLGEFVTVLAPRILVKNIKKRISESLKLYSS